MSKQKQIQFLKMYEPVHERFERFCRARVYGDMEYTDLINASLLAAFENLEDLKSKQAFLSYLCSISLRILANNHRKKKPKLELESKQYESSNMNDTSLSTDVSFLYDALRKINTEQREALILFEITGFSIKEIAEIQEVGISAVKQRLKRGRACLKEQLTFDATQLKKESNESR